MPYDEYLGRSETRSDTVWPTLVQGLAATLDIDPPGAELPPLWHWMLFHHFVPASGLGPDGHPKRGGFLPPVDDLPRRMWAGGRVDFLAVRHDIAGETGPAIREVQNIVYRSADGAAVKAAVPVPVPAGALVRTVRPDPVLLFRYSALTGNGHRIHYDQEYVTRVEGYPGLVVHGPLQATLLAGLACEMAGGPLAAFAYRGRRPAFHDRELTLLAVRDGARVRVESRDDSGAVCMEGEADFG